MPQGQSYCNAIAKKSLPPKMLQTFLVSVSGSPLLCPASSSCSLAAHKICHNVAASFAYLLHVPGATCLVWCHKGQKPVELVLPRACWVVGVAVCIISAILVAKCK